MVELRVKQEGSPYAFITSAVIESAGERLWKRVEVSHAEETFRFDVRNEPVRVLFNCESDIPMARPDFFTFSNFFDEYSNALIVYGTGEHIEANHSAALRLQTVLADQFTETLVPIRQDAEVTEADLAAHDLILIGGAQDNALILRLANLLGLKMGRNFYRWRERTFGEADEGLFFAAANPFSASKAAYAFCANSALEAYLMTKRFQALPSWALWKGDQIVERGYFLWEDPAQKADVVPR
ncbi:MAG TPA: hypothetical protein VL126_11490 [Bacteroidota bacterium]|nr:hypothetical protein [Bacteroidota bacterium]